jgi:hypothetical protein
MRIDSPHNTPLVILATAWGPKFGGINAFNEEMTRSLGIKADPAYDLICVVPRATEIQVVEAARSCHVRLVVLGEVAEDGKLPAELADAVLSELNFSAQQKRSAVWVGHDDKTGPLAIALRDLYAGSRAVLIHHMAFRAYEDRKELDSAVPRVKSEKQRAFFRRADLCFAVGPMLQEHLADLLNPVPNAPPIAMLVPALAEPDPAQVRLLDEPPHYFTAFLGGRLGSEDERIKQALLGVRGFGQAVAKLSVMPTINTPFANHPHCACAACLTKSTQTFVMRALKAPTVRSSASICSPTPTTAAPTWPHWPAAAWPPCRPGTRALGSRLGRRLLAKCQWPLVS